MSTAPTAPTPSAAASAATPWAVWALAPLLTLGPLLTCGIPRVMAPLFAACALIAVGVDAWQRRGRPGFDKGLAVLFGALIAFGMTSHFWTVNPDHTFSKAWQLTLNFGCLVLLVPVLGRLERRNLAQLGDFLMIGLGLGLAMYLSEMVHDLSRWC